MCKGCEELHEGSSNGAVKWTPESVNDSQERQPEHKLKLALVVRSCEDRWIGSSIMDRRQRSRKTPSCQERNYLHHHFVIGTYTFVLLLLRKADANAALRLLFTKIYIHEVSLNKPYFKGLCRVYVGG